MPDIFNYDAESAKRIATDRLKELLEQSADEDIMEIVNSEDEHV